MLNREQQREILAIGLLSLALFVLLALVPATAFGPAGPEWFPSGNPMGVMGTFSRDLLHGVLGVSALFVPILLLLGGLAAGGWVEGGQALRLAALVAGLLVLVPVGLHVTGWAPSDAGWMGESAGGVLLTGLGWLGASLVVGVLLLALWVATVGSNPLRTAGRGVAAGGGLVLRLLGRGGEALRTLATSIPLRRAGGGGSEERAEALRSPWEIAEEESAREAREVAGALAGGEAEAAWSAEGGAADGSGGSAVAGGAGTAVAGGADGSDGGDALLPDPIDLRDLEETGVPPIDLLSPPENGDRRGVERELEGLGEVLVEKLRTFNVESEIAGRTTGPVVTQYEVVPAPGVKVNRIANLDADLALAMKAPSVRIVAPIPGKGAVGVEIPNPNPETVGVREILESPAYRSTRAELPLALGKDLRGDPYVADLHRMPHALIAGATGSGKSVCLNSIITSLVYRHTPESVRLLMIDPKMVELSTYADLPHLRHPVVTDPREAAGALKWAVLEMERRYELLSRNGVRSIREFNRKVADGETLRRADAEGEEGDPDRWIYTGGRLPYVVLIIDELADLMMTVQSEVEKPLTLLAQKARAIGIHLIVATQRPSVNVITGLIKANFPCRIAFRVASKTDSRTILDQNGADALLGNGDMLFLPPGQGEPVRIQGAFVSTEDTDRLTSWYREQAALRRKAAEADEVDPGEAEAWISGAEDDILEVVREHEMEEATAEALEPDGPEDWDELFRAAAEVCVQHDQGSTSLLQRRLRVGYGRAARIVDQLHEAGILGPPDGTKPREVLVGMDEVEAICTAGELEAGE